MADTNPLEFELRRHPDLDVVTHGLTLWDLDREFPDAAAFGGPAADEAARDPRRAARLLLPHDRHRVHAHPGPGAARWIQDRVERPHASPDREEQLRILGKLNQAEAFETFLQTKFVGQKRFSLEGGESVIPLLDAVVSEAAHDDMDEVVVGMAHRGRLNVLANIVGKSFGQIFSEFEGNLDPRTAHGSGDVKYHLGADGHLHRARRRDGQGHPDLQPVSPRDRRPGRRRASRGRSRTSSTAARPASPCSRS